MTAQVKKYVITDFERIKDEGFEYTLSAQVMQIIQTIADQVGAPEYVRTPQFVKREVTVANAPTNGVMKGRLSTGTVNRQYGHNNHHGGQKNNNNKAQEITDADWEDIRRYQATVLPKRSGVEASIEEIRKLLNKMTDDTYETLKDQIFDELDTIMLAKCKIVANGDANSLDTDLNQIGHILFTIASGNSFYSAMYATLFKELMRKYSFMQTIFFTNFQEVASLFKDFAYTDPSVDYDKFCENNKTNERRRAMSLFYVNLMKQDVVENDPILDLISGLQTTLEEKIALTNQKNIVDEMTEVLFILITNSVSCFKSNLVDEDNSAWQQIKAKVKAVSLMRLKAYPSLTNKTIFKHIDMCDKF